MVERRQRQASVGRATVRIVWSLPVRGTRSAVGRGDLVRARCLIQALRVDGHNVQVVGERERPGAELTVATYRGVVRRALPRRAGLTIRDLGRAVDARAHARRVTDAVRDHRAELIVETQVHFGDSGAATTRATGLPLVLDDCAPVSEELVMGAGLPWLAHRLFARQLQAASRIVVSSHVLGELMLDAGAAADRICVVPNGVDHEAYDAIAWVNGRKANASNGQIVVGFVGSFQRWHGVELLIEALADLGDHPLKVALIGDGPTRLDVLRTASRLGIRNKVEAIGSVRHEAVPRFMANFDVGVIPGSNAYGHPMKLMEYAAMGIPIVAPDLPPVREIVRDGETAVLFEPGNPNALRHALQRLTAEPELRSSLGARARAEVAKSASWRNRARTLLEGL